MGRPSQNLTRGNPFAAGNHTQPGGFHRGERGLPGAAVAIGPSHLLRPLTGGFDQVAEKGGLVVG
jgi:hypothetical protein